MVVVEDSGNEATATKDSELPARTSHEEPQNISNKKKKKKQRWSSAKKKEVKEQRIEQEKVRRLNPPKGQKRKRARTTTKLFQDPPRDAIDRILQCAEKSLFTDSIVVENRKETCTDTTNTSEKQGQLVVEILSGCDLSKENTDNENPLTAMGSSTPPSATTLFMKTICTIKVQPLLVLDLNGILCHRDRKHKRLKDWKLRPSIGHVANTDIIPRTDLLQFLRYLDQHFCLAIWTSAKPKTAKKLLNLLLSSGNENNIDSKGIRNRLLFVWSQSQCTAVRSSEREDGTSIPESYTPTNEPQGGRSTLDPKEDQDDDEHSFDETVVFEKHLPKIWESYPLWSANNTLLIDDSPEKCPIAVANAIHPPPLHGRNWNSDSKNGEDQDNQKRQTLFFEKVVSFWVDSPHREQLCKDDEGGTLNNTHYYEFLQNHAQGHMGWRGSQQNGQASWN
uniref:Mitochondrial import inner membrane translocase subunit TIM50 n=1 Tax=Pseudo-nitzschia delicatissima TaxID=44447 RepID=A0A7S0TBU3_9STRA|mmetsp:Transcript_721/g.1643  ORF Transcript_721/g.1643 Transcript_721/m.1643 type:complete len:449 (+) Transcript_721:111-1457(+)